MGQNKRCIQEIEGSLGKSRLLLISDFTEPSQAEAPSFSYGVADYAWI